MTKNEITPCLVENNQHTMQETSTFVNKCQQLTAQELIGTNEINRY